MSTQDKFNSQNAETNNSNTNNVGNSQDRPSKSPEPISTSSGIKNSLNVPGGIELPKGGGAIRGIGEKAEVNPVNGSGTVSIPLPLTPGRSDFTPQLSLSYSSGSGNSEFGLGWNVGLPEITRKTDKELPRYQDVDESDTFILSGAEDLVPITDSSGNIIETYDENLNLRIRQYYPRTEGLNAKIERITKTSGEIYWRVTSKDNIRSLYGYSDSARISDPENTNRIFSWKLQYSMDSLGNLVKYIYTKDDTSFYASIYLESVKYNNTTQVNVLNGRSIEYEVDNYGGDFYFELNFIYQNNRDDSFSIFKPGFELRNTKLCTSIEMYHNIRVNGSMVGFVRSLQLDYKFDTKINLLDSIELLGYDNTKLPPIKFNYTMPELAGKVKVLDTKDLENIPGGLNDGVSFNDLWGEGISGVLTKRGKSWYYKPNMGNRQWYNEDAEDEIDLDKMHILREMSSLADSESVQLIDIDGDGLNEIQILSGRINGWHSFDESGNLGKFVPFKHIPNINLNDPELRMIDLNGDGYPDLLINADSSFIISYSLGKDGYSNFNRISKAINEEEGPRVIFNEQLQTIFLADMSGDGLNDIVRIKNGSICYWPNLGYGRFGKKRIMSGSPTFDYINMFDPSRIRLADIDGSGTTDVIYLGVHQTFYWKNLSGNSWSEAIEILRFPKAGSLDNVSVFDIEGNGTSAIVWSSPLPGISERIKYIELTNGKKPFLLNEIDNNMGAVRKLYYAPSTKFYMQDKRAGRPWITKLGFPVHVVERMEIIDKTTDSKFVNRYAYHHGYFDGTEREFRGFGMVEQWDSEELKVKNKKLKVGEATNPLSILDTPPVYTKTWFHTGFYKNSDNVTNQYKQEYFEIAPQWILPDTILPEGLTPQEKREAARVMKGSILRQEVYSLDDSELQNVPYTVTENSYKIKLKQKVLNNKHGVFMVMPDEAININYERNVLDPRIVHTINLKYDEYGNPLNQANIAYRRLIDSTPGQEKTLVSIKEYRVFNTNSNHNFHRIGTPIEEKNFETIIFSQRDTKIRADELMLPNGEFHNHLNLNKIQHIKIYYYSDDSHVQNELGIVPFHALVYHTLTLAYDEYLIYSLPYNDGRSNTPQPHEIINYLLRMGYIPMPGDRSPEFWMPSERIYYSHFNFFLPIHKFDFLLNQTNLYYDSFYLLPIRVEDAENYITTIVNDYYNMQPIKITDPNGNSTEMRLNSLGMVMAQAVYKESTGEGDSIYSPTVMFEYYLNNWSDNGEPAYAVSRAKVNHGSYNSAYIENYEYTSGLGQPVLVKLTAENGDAYDSNGNFVENCRTRFVASGRIVYNNKGDIVMQYEPWYSDNPGYENNDIVMNKGVTPIMYYDPLGRLIKTDFPDGTTTRVEFNAWEQYNYDQNDCDSGHQNYNTPQKVHINPLGIVVCTIDDNRENLSQELDGGYKIETTLVTDILGQVVEVIDALGRQATSNIYNFAGQLIYTHNIDSGIRQFLYNPAKLPVYTWDNIGNMLINEYNRLLNPTNTLLSVDNSEFSLIQRIEYGSDMQLNNINRIWHIYDQDAKTSHLHYDFKGNLLFLTKRFLVDYSGFYIDFNNFDENLGLQSEEFIQHTEYNALNQPIIIHQPNTGPIFYEYDKGALLKAVRTDSAGVTNITYNARGQREDVYYDNGSKTRYDYDPNNFRLIRLLTTRNAGSETLQDIQYRYDPVGNILSQIDDAQQEVYFKNSVMYPESYYEYDAVYRLKMATGREQSSLIVPNWDDFPNNIPMPNTGYDAMQSYRHHYEYDKLGNIQQDAYKQYFYDSGTNRLLKHDQNQSFDDYYYDQHGNVITMPNMYYATWNHKNELVRAYGGSYYSYYQYDYQGNRSRKVVEKGNIREERYYIGNSEVFRRFVNNSLDYERTSNNLSDGDKVFARVDVKNGNEVLVKYQYDNHLGSACLELDHRADIISYEEYHPFGTTSYRAGRSETEVSLKRYKYCGKERDEETGLYYYGARYYASWICRFVSVDPLNEKYPELSAYQYASNNPISMIDLDGLEGVKPDRNLKKEHNRNIMTSGNKVYEFFPKSGTFKSSIDGEEIDKGYYHHEATVMTFSKLTSEMIRNSASFRRELLASNLPENLHNAVFYSHIYGAQRDFISAPQTKIAAAVVAAPFAIEAIGATTVKGLFTSNIASRLGSAGSDFLMQWAYTKDLNKINFTSVATSGLIKNPFTSSFIGSIGEYSIEYGLRITTDKTFMDISIETGLGTLFGGAKNQALKNIGMKSFLGNVTTSTIFGSQTSILNTTLTKQFQKEINNHLKKTIKDE